MPTGPNGEKRPRGTIENAGVSLQQDSMAGGGPTPGA